MRKIHRCAPCHRPASSDERRDTLPPGKSGAPLSAQMIFQDPYASLNPRWRVKNIIAEPLRELKLRKTAAEVTERVEELLGIVGLSPSDGEKFPHEFSGGQRQRISIARALRASPNFWSATSRPRPSTCRCRRRS